MRVLISDARQSVRHALHLLLQQADNMVIETAATPEELVDKSIVFHPDVVLLDWELDRGTSSYRLMTLLRAADEHTRIIVLGIDPDARAAALSSGSDAFISKSDPPEEVLDILRKVIESHLK